MKNVFKLFRITALVAVIGFAVSASFAACDMGGDGGENRITASALVLPAGQAWVSGGNGLLFRADGTGASLSKVSTPDDRSRDYYISGNREWEIDDGRLYMRTPPSVFMPQAGAWSNQHASIRGNTLTLRSPDGSNSRSFTPQPVNIVR